jgi:hypothetical protein
LVDDNPYLSKTASYDTVHKMRIDGFESRREGHLEYLLERPIIIAIRPKNGSCSLQCLVWLAGDGENNMEYNKDMHWVGGTDEKKADLSEQLTSAYS